jgi:hypothetical protein
VSVAPGAIRRTGRRSTLIRLADVHRDEIIIFTRSLHGPCGSPTAGAESDEPAVIKIGVARMRHEVLALGQVKAVERTSVAQMDVCSTIPFREVVAITLPGAATVLTEREGAVLLVQQGAPAKREVRPPFKLSLHPVRPVKDEPVNCPITS